MQDDGQADSRFGGGNRNDEKDDDLSVYVGGAASEGDEGEICGIEHDLDRQKHGDQILFYKKSDDAQEKKDDTEDEVIMCRYHSFSCFFIRTMAPTRAAIIKTDVISKG